MIFKVGFTRLLFYLIRHYYRILHVILIESEMMSVAVRRTRIRCLYTCIDNSSNTVASSKQALNSFL